MTGPAHREDRAPWGFRIVLAAAAFYLVVRLVQMVGWAVNWLT